MSSMFKSRKLHPDNLPTSNLTKPGHSDTSSGFQNPYPNAGTFNRDFTFQADPWQIVGIDGGALFYTLSAIHLTVSQNISPDNKTTSYVVLTWKPQATYFPSGPPEVTLALLNSNGGTLQSLDLGRLPFSGCTDTNTQTLSASFDNIYFNNVEFGLVAINEGYWKPC